jgi:hypothetical protein
MVSRLAVPSDPTATHRWLLLPHWDVTDEGLDAFLTVFDRFAALGNAGAFVRQDADGGSCSMRIREAHRSADGPLELLVDVAYCDPRYARVLRNVIFGLGEMLASPALEFGIEPATAGSTSRELNAEVDEEEVLAGRFYPDLSSRLSAKIQFLTPPNYRSGRRVWISTATDLTTPLVEDLIRLVELWGSVLMTAFPMSEEQLTNGQTMILNVEGSQHDEVTFEVLVDRFIAAEAAFYSLINLVVLRASRETAVLEAVGE